jgi:hypothetical protein
MEVLGVHQILAICKTKQGDYFELPCTNIVEAKSRTETLAKSLGLQIASMEIPEEAKRINLYGAETPENQRRSPRASTRRNFFKQVTP